MKLTLETKRLILRPFTIDDAGEMFCGWASDPEVTKYLTWNTHKSIEETKKIFCHLPVGTRNYPNGAADDSHMQLDGVTRVAALFLERLEHPEISDGEMTGLREEYDCSALIDREDSVVDR